MRKVVFGRKTDPLPRTWPSPVKSHPSITSCTRDLLREDRDLSPSARAGGSCFNLGLKELPDVARNALAQQATCFASLVTSTIRFHSLRPHSALHHVQLERQIPLAWQNKSR